MVTRKTNRGSTIDIDAMMSASNPSSPSLGNMKTNARGDVLGPNGEIVQKSEDRVRAYYKDNPKSSTSTASLRGTPPKLTPDDVDPGLLEPKTAKTAKENVRTAKKNPKPATVEAAPLPVDEPEEFAAPEGVEPLGYKEVEQPNGDVEMVPYYNEDDA